MMVPWARFLNKPTNHCYRLMDFLLGGGFKSQQIQRSISLAANFLRLLAETYEMLELNPGALPPTNLAKNISTLSRIVGIVGISPRLYQAYLSTAKRRTGSNNDSRESCYRPPQNVLLWAFDNSYSWQLYRYVTEVDLCSRHAHVSANEVYIRVVRLHLDNHQAPRLGEPEPLSTSEINLLFTKRPSCGTSVYQNTFLCLCAWLAVFRKGRQFVSAQIIIVQRT